MSGTQTGSDSETHESVATAVPMRLEVVTVPVADVDRAKSFYVDQIGFHADVDVQVHDDLRFVQVTAEGEAFQSRVGRAAGVGW